MGALPKEDRLFTYADYKSWELADGERYELICGEAYAMAAPNTRHQLILAELLGRFYVYLEGKTCKVIPAPFDVRLFYEADESDGTVVQPDISVICDKKKIGEEGGRGAPDIVIEILSPSNTVREMKRKLKLYQNAGVREYWVVDGDNNEIEAYRFGDSLGFQVYGNDAEISSVVLPGLRIKLAQVFGV